MAKGSRGGRNTGLSKGLESFAMNPSRKFTSGGKEAAGKQDSSSNSQMKNIPSVSRNRGLDKDGDALTRKTTQDQYWEFIQDQLNTFWKDFPAASADSPKKSEQCANILILFRKLREGILAAHRVDDFARQVYETSLHLAILFKTPAQVNGIANHLRDVHSVRAAAHLSPEDIQRVSLTTAVVLLHDLNMHYPSQKEYFERLDTLPDRYLDRAIPVYKWLSSLRSSMHLCEYVKFDKLTRQSTLKGFLPSSRPESENSSSKTYVADALKMLVASLRDKVRNSSWACLRRAYRDLSVQSDNDTAIWMSRMLLLDVDMGKSNSAHTKANTWIQSKRKVGELKEKEDRPGQWIICR